MLSIIRERFPMTENRFVMLRRRMVAMPHKSTKAWEAKRNKVDDELYEEHGRSFEETHEPIFCH